MGGGYRKQERGTGVSNIRRTLPYTPFQLYRHSRKRAGSNTRIQRKMTLPDNKDHKSNKTNQRIQATDNHRHTVPTRGRHWEQQKQRVSHQQRVKGSDCPQRQAPCVQAQDSRCPQIAPPESPCAHMGKGWVRWGEGRGMNGLHTVSLDTFEGVVVSLQ